MSALPASEEWSIKTVVLRLKFSDLIVEEDRVEFELNGTVLRLNRSEAKFDFAACSYRWIEFDLKQRWAGLAAPSILTQVEMFSRYR